MKFKIHWLEIHNFDSEKEDKEYLSYLPPESKITGRSGEGEGLKCLN